ncbi:putative RNA pseudouridine synthase [Campylobacterota bacterium]|nr:putative RNA pseudouridine synthase [Campylobacterota bacterium]
MTEKAYKLLAAQQRISNGEAKKLIDNGLVMCGGKKLTIARKELESGVVFTLIEQKKPTVITQDGELLAVDKPIGVDSYDLERQFGLKLVHRLDKPTSGVLLLAKTDEFLAAAIAEFKKRSVVKKYLAVVEGMVAEEAKIDQPIFTQKGAKARSIVDKKRGSEAITTIKPLLVVGKHTLLEVGIETGRTHQIRVHLAHIGLPVLGDDIYGGKAYKRLMLHASFISILGREITAPTPAEFNFLMR